MWHSQDGTIWSQEWTKKHGRNAKRVEATMADRRSASGNTTVIPGKRNSQAWNKTNAKAQISDYQMKRDSKAMKRKESKSSSGTHSEGRGLGVRGRTVRATIPEGGDELGVDDLGGREPLILIGLEALPA